MIDYVAKAKDLAHRAHAGQVDKAGRPYIEHVARVAAAVADDPQAEAVAWLHDVLEDGDPEIHDGLGDFPFEIEHWVSLLTRHEHETEADYYRFIAYDPIVLRVKLADIADNADEARLALLDEQTAARLRRKYAKAIQALTSEGGRDE